MRTARVEIVVGGVVRQLVVRPSGEIELDGVEIGVVRRSGGRAARAWRAADLRGARSTGGYSAIQAACSLAHLLGRNG